MRTRNLRLLAVVFVAVPLALAAGCAGLGRTDVAKPVRDGGLSEKLHPFVYYEQGTTLFMAVDVRAAQYVKEGDIFPLGVGLANLDREPLTFGTESFVVETADGVRYPVIGTEEYQRHYDRSKTDARLGSTFGEVMRSRFQSYNPVSWRPFPVAGAEAVTQSSVELGRNYWTRAYLYFPVPPSGIHGAELTLVASPDGTDERFLLTFSVP